MNTDSEQGAGAAIDLFLKLAIAPVNILVKHNQRVVIGILRGDLVKLVANGHTQQWLVRHAAGVAG
ncbi:hypothetical protein HSBAA_26340 [Vreelandella sulfidaeris]|uniref:Uncharacterized protein n=1 Tax=Vreelandella sulfidaeris TaxID=115553 RepID=A0A455UAL2_9GAMM|nr:hypothetical protein HSBAA_26340 [Halomonas sulfidaeris]